ncbi:hypothetical protein E5S69_11565 [Cupriavidus necator]|uniref:hypothetical protein n=1 Tax=Cupriavidus necator TaxID=106590 RepID=UPI00148FD508|nr:hypothetical protein [Cupriavidus necator]NOV24149.1 hypothetical protein [Cupriavidus necator]
MSILDPRLWLAFLIVLGVAAGGGYLKGRSDGKAVERAAAQKDIQAWHDNADAAYSLYLEARDKKQIEYRTITKTVEAAKHATPDIPDCRTGDDWMRIYRDNAAVANGTAVPARARSADGADAR